MFYKLLGCRAPGKALGVRTRRSAVDVQRG